MNAEQAPNESTQEKKSNTWIWILIVVIVIVLALIGVALGFTVPTL